MYPPGPNMDAFGSGDLPDWISSLLNFAASVTGVSMFASLLNSSGLGETTGMQNPSLKILLMLGLGYVLNVARKVALWAYQRFSFQYYITAQFQEGDPTYEWLVLLLTSEKVWKKSKDFRVTSKTSQMKWSIGLSTTTSAVKEEDDENAEYVPTYSAPQIWRWNGYWIEVTRNVVPRTPMDGYYGGSPNPHGTGSSLYLTIYTFDMQVLSKLVETARKKYFEVSRPYIIIHTIDTLQPNYGPVLSWNNVKRKNRRPLESIILTEGVIDSIIQDAREFIDMEEWYMDAGIPHRRGYLLHGPPGTGKSSTIFAIAGELGMEIYSLSLAANFVDDSVLARAATSIPKNSIFLIEDIDCAFPSREDESPTDPNIMSPYGMYTRPRIPGTRSAVTLSGLLNVLDGVGSEEGKLFFATTNYIDHLDAALLRPGRIDMKVEYHLSNKDQAAALFRRFYPTKHIKLTDTYPSPRIGTVPLIDHPIPAPAPRDAEVSDLDEKRATVAERIARMADSFAEKIPEGQFSTAELQGYLLGYKKEPVYAVESIAPWIEREQAQREEKRRREESKRAKAKEKSKEMLAQAGLAMYSAAASSGMVMAPMPPAVVAETAGDVDAVAGLARKTLPSPTLEKEGEISVVPLEE